MALANPAKDLGRDPFDLQARASDTRRWPRHGVASLGTAAPSGALCTAPLRLSSHILTASCVEGSANCKLTGRPK